MGNIQPYVKGFNTQGNTQFFGLFNNDLHTVTNKSSSGDKYENTTATYNSPSGRRVIAFSQRAEPGETVYPNLYLPTITPMYNASRIVWNGTALFRIKLSTGYYCCFAQKPSYSPNSYYVKVGFYTSDSATESGSGLYNGGAIEYNIEYIKNNTMIPRIVHFGKCKLGDGKIYVGVFIGGTEVFSGRFYSTMSFVGVKESDLIELGASQKDISDTFGEPSKTEGYVPHFDTSSDLIAIPTTPTIGVTSGGFVNVYKVTTGALNNMANELFPQVVNPIIEGEGTPKDIATSLYALLQSYMNRGLLDYVLDCHVIPCNPTAQTQSEQVKVGYRTLTTTYANKLTSDYVDVNCGSLSIEEFYGNFIDYLTTFKLYLPFIGFVPIKAEFIQGGTLSVNYRFNVIDGSFMCYVKSTSSKSELQESVIGTFSGNCCVHIPISGTNYATMFNGVLSNGASAVTSAITGNVGGAVTSALNTMSVKPSFEQSNAYNGTSAFLSPRTPYLLIERPVANRSETSLQEKGLPLNVSYKLSDVTGYTELDNVVVTGITATTSEQDELKRLLESGVIL